MLIKSVVVAMMVSSTLFAAMMVSSTVSYAANPAEPVNLDKKLIASTKSQRFITGVSVQLETTDVEYGTEVYQRPDGSCYEKSRKIESLKKEKTNIKGVELVLPQVSTSTKEVACTQY